MTCTHLPTRLLRPLCALLYLAVATTACKSSKPGFSPGDPFVCEVEGRRPDIGEQVCIETERYIGGACGPARCDAEDSGCCPGQFCTGGGECQIPPSRIQTCTADNECSDGQLCLSRPRVSDSMTCGFLPVDNAGACPQGLTPYNQRCVREAPCDGSCPTGSVCNIDTNQCEAPPAVATGCDQMCDASSLLVYADPDTMLFDACCAVSCACETLPALNPGNWGRFSDIALTADDLLVSAYDATYGDLVVATVDRLTQQVSNLDYVDGVPTTGPVIADPAGPRGGRADLGEDVGQYTSLALTGSGEPRVVYYDVDSGDLKYASRSGTTWATTVIDDGAPGVVGAIEVGDVGRYASLKLDNGGVPHVSYFAFRLDDSDTVVTTPMYARATSASPAGPSDWETLQVDPITSCDACPDGDVCTRDPSTGDPVCATPAMDCAATCDCDNVCVATAGPSECRTQWPIGLDVVCDGACPMDTVCAADGTGSAACYEDREIRSACEAACEADCDTTCAGDMTCADACKLDCPTNCDGSCDTACTGDEECLGDPAAPTVAAECRLEAPVSLIDGLPEGNGLFTSLVLQGDPATPVVVYYDRVRGHLRGAQADFDVGETLGSFVARPLACDPNEDFGQHAYAALAGDDSLAVVYQGLGGETLWIFQGTDILDLGATREIVDDGVRTAQVNLVGAGARVAFDGADTPFIVYQDQTNNDLLLARDTGSSWTVTPILTDGAFGSFPRIAISGQNAFVTTYERGRDEFDNDISQLVVDLVDLTTLP